MNYNKLMNNLAKKHNDLGCGTYLVAFIIALALIFAFSCLNAWIGMLLWNWIVVGELGLFATKIGFWPMWGLVELCSILFKSKNFDTGNNED